jgi:hypothetical protein
VDAKTQTLLERWEGMEGGKQAMYAFPVLAVVLALLHIGPLNQPLGRAIGYGLFWALPATAAVVSATAHERRKRAARAAAESPPDDGPGSS